VANAAVRQINPALFVTLDLRQRLNNVSWDDAFLDTLGLDANQQQKQPAVGHGSLVRYDEADGIDVLTVGPIFPGPHDGGIYVERERFHETIRPIFDPDATLWPDSERHTYEFMSSARRTSTAPLRYHGFHAKVVASDGLRKVVNVKRSSFEGPPDVDVEINVNDRATCDDPAFLSEQIQDPRHPAIREPVIDAGSGINDEGAVFLPLELCVGKGLRGHKEPPGGGDFFARAALRSRR
jgi:hypothetical protein